MKFISVIAFCLIGLLTGCSHSQVQSHKITKNASQEQQKVQEKKESPSQSQKKTGVSVQQIVSLAETGKASNIPFTAHLQTISDVKKAWGNPDRIDYAGNGYYATYSKRYAAFGYTKDGHIFDVRSYDPSIQVFSLSEITDVLGSPAGVTSNSDDKIYTYKLNTQYQLKWVIPSSTGKVDHISVYSPNDLAQAGSQSYILSILGTSKYLSASAWNKMLEWRRQILAFPKSYPNDVFVNGPDKKMVALTFDDGPDLINTPKIIEALKQQNVKGTFFFIGEKVQKYPEVVKSAYENGNDVESHSFYHHELPSETASEIHQDLQKTSEAIRAVIGKAPSMLRPPYGEVDQKLINVARNDHYKLIIWSIDTLDWSQKEQAHIEKNVFDNVRNGDIILMHCDDDKTETAKAVPAIIKELKQRGFEIVDIATLLNTNPYQ